MKRSAGSITVQALREQFLSIDFPEYQRESTVWDVDQKQRLIDSIHRQFDIAAVFMYRNDDGTLDCIDGRQRINTIMSYLEENPSDKDNGFHTVISNEVVDEPGPLDRLNRKTFSEIGETAATDPEAAALRQAFLDYKITLVTLSDVVSPDEFNLQFLRLNLGALINAGEKLNAMVGEARDLIFNELGVHPFLNRPKVPTRRFARQQIAAQALYQAYNMQLRNEFVRARHLDLQRFFKEQYELDPRARGIAYELWATMDALDTQGDEWSGLLRNRAITVSILLLAWELGIDSAASAGAFVTFLRLFVDALNSKVEQIRELDPAATASRTYLIDFQRNVTQAAVEKPAVEQRHRILHDQYAHFLDTGLLRE